MDTSRPRRRRDHSEYAEPYRALVAEDYPLAIRCLEALGSRLRRSAAVRNDLGVCLYLAGDRPAARRTLEEARRLGGRGSAAEINLGYLFHPDGFAVRAQGLARHAYRLPEAPAGLAGERVSIVLLEYNNPALTLDCLRSLREHPPSFPFEVLLIDNSEGPPAADYRAACGLEAFRYRKNERNAGFAGGCNQGAALASGSLIFFVNNDVLFREGAVDRLAEVMVSDPAAGAAGSKLLYGDGSVQHAGIVFSHLCGSPAHRCRYGLEDDPAANVPVEIQAVTGASLMIRSDLFRSLGGFSEAYRNGYEDIDLCLRVRRAGRKVVYNPRSVLVHLESMSPGRTRHEEANQALFRAAWGRAVQRDELEYLGPHQNFLLSATDNLRRWRLERQVLRLWAVLIRRHPAVAARLPLACLEEAKHLRVQRIARNLVSFLQEEGEREAARTVYRAFLVRHGFRVGSLRALRRLLRTGPSDPAEKA